MKKQLLLLTLAFVAGSFISNAQELIKGGNMETEADWQFATPMGSDVTDLVTATFNSTKDLPTGGEGGCLELSGFGTTRSAVWQGVTIIPGHSYTFSGLLKNIATEPLKGKWIEFVLSRYEPDPAKDYNASKGDYWFTNNSWMEEPWGQMDDMDGSLIDVTQFIWRGQDTDGKDLVLTSNTFTIPDTVSVTEWFVVIKTGSWTSAGDETSISDFLIDNLSLIDNDVTGIAQVKTKNNFSVFPNPSNGLVNIKSSANSLKANYELYNVAGMLVESGKLENTQLDLKSLNKGSYVLKLINNSSVESHKLVLQ